MKRLLTAIVLVLALCAASASAQAAQKLNIYLDKESLLAHEMPVENIRIRPEGMVRIMRHSLWPWDDEGTRWSMFVEIENISDEKIVVDENCLIACRTDREEIAAADYVFECTTNVIAPGEKTVLHAGAYPYVQTKRTNADAALDVWDVQGMEDFADRIRQAAILRVRLEVRGNESTQNWPAVDLEPRVWIEGSTLCYEWTNDTETAMDFRTIGAVVCDKEGRVIDVISSTYSRGASAVPGETLRFEKELAPYITQEMIDGAVFETFAFALAHPQ